jgi:hypothetical protein
VLIRGLYSPPSVTPPRENDHYHFETERGAKLRQVPCTVVTRLWFG